MRKRFAAILLMLLVVFGTGGAVWAAENQDAAAAEGLKSYGKITFQNGKDEVLVDSQDFYKLEDRINQLKRGMAVQLKEMHTYFTTGDGISLKTNGEIRVAHTEPSGDTVVDPLSVDFSTLLEGVAASQSVPSDVTAYDYPAGTVLYMNADGALTTDGSEKGAERIDIKKASAENLSAGMAAWVEGKLILGTGKDNESYLKKGRDESSGGFILTHTPNNPNSEKYMCYAYQCFHHSLAGEGGMVLPKSAGSKPFGYHQIYADPHASLPYLEDEVNYYLWGPINTKDFW